MPGPASPRHRASAVTLGVVVALLAGCGSIGSLENGQLQPPFSSDPTQPFSLIVVNIDGPPVDVFVDGGPVVHAVCAPGGLDMPPEVVSTAPFPWHIVVRRTGGPVLKTFDVTDTQGPQTVLVRTWGATLIPAGQNAGPAPAASCGP